MSSRVQSSHVRLASGVGMNYWELPGLDDVYLEDSWVREVQIGDSSIRFTLDLVLRENSPRYTPPLSGEQYCYAPATLEFDHATQIKWTPSDIKPAVDPDGSVDFGNIDNFEVDGDVYHLEGDWGEATIYTSTPPRIDFAE